MTVNLARQQRLAATGDESGASAVEYGLLIAAIAVVISTLVFALGSMLGASLTKTCDGVKAGTSSTAGATC